jgi:DNA-binding SARP family transcriptional activator
MSSWKVTLFGKFNIERDNRKIDNIEARKVQELICYLLIFRDHPHPRELLSEALWQNQSSDKSRKYLRQTLWRLQSALRKNVNSSEPILLIDQDFIQFNFPADIWLDIAEFEKIFDLVKGKEVQELGVRELHFLEYASEIYTGDLLEGLYQDWCIFERERFQIMHLMLLDKLVQYCELHQMYEVGLIHGMKILRQDRAYERTHRQLMRLYFLAGNRTQALHQYMSCVTALRDDLGVEPSERTKQLYEQIRLDTFKSPNSAMENVDIQAGESTLVLNDALNHLEQFAEKMKTIESQVQQEIETLESVLSDRS